MEAGVNAEDRGHTSYNLVDDIIGRGEPCLVLLLDNSTVNKMCAAALWR